jgi:L-lysine exporter family protein LysE/ArgO
VAFVHGFLLALALILPIGPQNAWVLEQGMTSRRWRDALPVAVAASLCDTLLIAAAVGGVSLVLVAAPVLRDVLRAAGVAFLAFMGYRMWTAGDAVGTEAGREGWTFGRRIRYTLSVSLLNPHAISDTVMVIGAGSAAYAAAHGRWAYALGAAVVSWLWFSALALAGRAVAPWVGGRRAQRAVRRGSALVMWWVAARSALAWAWGGATHA